MINRRKAQRILWYEGLGFALIILLSWLDELLKLPNVLFGGSKETNWRESAMESIVVMLVWLMVFTLTRRLLNRLYYLEGFLRVCAWCKRIHHEDEWMPLEAYFTKGFETQTTHSVCPDCTAKLLGKTT